MLGRARTPDEVAWHEVECGTYSADLPLWEELAEEHGGPILELGCGTGRVALHLARQGHDVLGLDTERSLVDTLNARAREAELPARAIVADAASFDLDERFPLVIAPMQLVQLLDRARRRAMLARVAGLQPGGVLAASLVEADSLPEPTTEPARDEVPPPPTCASSTGGSTRACRSTSVARTDDLDRAPPPGGGAGARSPRRLT